MKKDRGREGMVLAGSPAQAHMEEQVGEKGLGRAGSGWRELREAWSWAKWELIGRLLEFGLGRYERVCEEDKGEDWAQDEPWTTSPFGGSKNRELGEVLIWCRRLGFWAAINRAHMLALTALHWVNFIIFCTNFSTENSTKSILFNIKNTFQRLKRRLNGG